MASNSKGLNTTIHAPARLQALVALPSDGALDYATLKQRIAVSANSLALHLGMLEEAMYIGCKRAFVGERPRSIYHITPVGRKSLAKYLAAMQSVVDSVKNAKAR